MFSITVDTTMYYNFALAVQGSVWYALCVLNAHAHAYH